MISIKDRLREFNIPFQENVSLKEKTWIKTGGTVSLWIVPTTVEGLETAIEILCSHNIEFELVGHTSNIYYFDDYNPKVIISTIKVKQFEEKDSYIECACGTPVAILSRFCVEKGYKGYYGLVNLPGTVGAALCNNSSCFDCSISEHLIDSTFYDLDKKKVVSLKPNDFDFKFRNSKLKIKKLKGVILLIKLEKRIGNVEEEKSKAAKATYLRKITLEAPAYTLGSVYAGLTHKNSFKAKLAVWGGRIMRVCGIYNKKRYINFLLALYGYSDIKDFVSDRNMNTFKWLPNRTDKNIMFQRYQNFIGQIYKDPKLEIEIRDGGK